MSHPPRDETPYVVSRADSGAQAHPRGDRTLFDAQWRHSAQVMGDLDGLG
ncbi:hypothetical protein [Gephyromycinifex aptenodytis]|nr:hypothetical protein [Gephyromycinifex aptenodytis]